MTRADNRNHLINAAHTRSRATRERAIAAIQSMINDGAAITFESVAAKAGVSRSWLYSAADLRVQIAELRADTTSSIKRPTKLSQRATDMSLLTRLEVTQERLRQVIAENTHLRAQLELALGVNRAGRQGLKSTTEIRN